jgi:Metallo-beta-lactamase superfamily
MGGAGDKDSKPVVRDDLRDPLYPSGSFLDVSVPGLVGSNSVASLFWSPSANRCEPIPPPPLPRCLPMGLDLSIPAIGKDGSFLGTTKRRIEFDEPIASSKSILLYAVPRSLVETVEDESRGICEPTQDPEADGGTCEAEDSSIAADPPVFGPQQQPQQTIFTPPVQLRPPVPALEVLELRGDFAITRHYSAYAVGAGSLTVVRSEHGVITLVDAGVGNIAHSELTESILAELAVDIGKSPIAEVLLSHLHEDHTSLLPELARRYPIGKIRINSYQHQDPRMLTILKKVAQAAAERIRNAVTAEAETTRKAWEVSPKRGQVDVNGETREATWKEHVDGLVEAELARSAIKLETAFVDANGEVHVTESPLLGDLILPPTPDAPVMLERGYLESSSATGPRITTARPRIAFDLDALIKKQLEGTPGDPDMQRATDYAVDANEATFVIDLGTAARLFVSPDKRTPNIASLKDVLEADVRRLNTELERLGRKPAKLHIWNMSHHAQVGFIADASQVKSLVTNLHTLTRVKHASGGRTMDVVLVSGHVATDGTTQTLVDPLTVWTLNEMGIDVIVATDKTVELLEVLLHDGTSVAGLTEAPYKTGIASEGTLRKVEAALRKIADDIQVLETTKPRLKGSTRPVYDERTKKYDADLAALEKFKTDLETARDAYVEYHEAKLRPGKDGKAAPGIPPGDAEAAAKKAVLDTLLADQRVRGVAEDAAAKTPVFDPVALTLMKQPTNGIPRELRQIVDAILRADALRQQLADADSIDTRAEFAKELTALKPLLAAHAEKAPPGTKEVIESVLHEVEGELGQVTKPPGGNGEVSNATTPDGAFTVEQRLQFEKAKPLGTSGDGVRWFADKTTRPLGALMIYSIVKKQDALKQGLADDNVTIPEFALGTIHSAYGMSIGVRMLQKVPVSNGEFAILAVVDIFETTSRHYATSEERWTAIEYSLIRNVLQVGLSYLGTWMMTKKNRYVAAAGFLLQFAVDPFLEYIGLYSWLEKKNDFLPDDVVTVRQRIRGLMSEYTTLIGLLELSRRQNLSSMSEDSEVGNRIQSEITSYRAKVTKTEASLLAAFDDGYYTAKTAFAGLLDLDRLRAQFLELQLLAHQGDTDNDPKSRRQILDAFAKIEDDIGLDWMSDDAIRMMPQWGALDGTLNELERRAHDDVNWEAVTDTQNELDQMLANARYRLDPGPLRVRTAPLLTPGTQAHATYEALLDTRETRAATIYERLFGATPVEPTEDPIADALTRADRAVATYAAALAAVPAFEGLTARQLEENSFDLAKTYPSYVSSHGDYSHGLDKLQAAESMLKSTVMRLDALAMPVVTAPMSSFVTTRVEGIHDAMAAHMAERIASGFLFADEAKQRALDIRPVEDAEIAKKLGETGVQALSSPERMAIITRDLAVSSSSTFIDRLNAMPMLARVGGDGYMEGVYRYVGWDATESDNVLVGDLRRTMEVPDAMGDTDRDAHLFVPLNQAAIDIWPNHFMIFVEPVIGRSPYADVPRPCLEFDDDEKAALRRIKFEELKR